MKDSKTVELATGNIVAPEAPVVAAQPSMDDLLRTPETVTPQNNNDALSSVKRPKWTSVSSTRYNFVIFEGENALMYQVSIKVQY